MIKSFFIPIFSVSMFFVSTAALAQDEGADAVLITPPTQEHNQTFKGTLTPPTKKQKKQLKKPVKKTKKVKKSANKLRTKKTKK